MDKAAIKEEIIYYLKRFGYPQMDPKIVFNYLPDIYKMLCDKRLITPSEIPYAKFLQTAQQEYNAAKLQEQMREFTGGSFSFKFQ